MFKANSVVGSYYYYYYYYVMFIYLINIVYNLFSCVKM